MENNKNLKKEMKYAFLDLQIKCDEADVGDRAELRMKIDTLATEIAKLNIALLKEGTIVTDEDMKEMADIQKGIEDAADKQQLILSIVKAVAFIAKKVM